MHCSCKKGKDMFICDNVNGLLLQDCILISTVIASSICSCVLFVGLDSN